MLAVEVEEFSKAITAAIAPFRQCDQSEAKFWFNCLREYALTEVRDALVEYGRNGARAPQPTAIIALISAKRAKSSPIERAASQEWHANDLICAAQLLDSRGVGAVKAVYDDAMADCLARAAVAFPQKTHLGSARALLKQTRWFMLHKSWRMA